jgi:hypothetical protein
MKKLSMQRRPKCNRCSRSLSNSKPKPAIKLGNEKKRKRKGLQRNHDQKQQITYPSLNGKSFANQNGEVAENPSTE